MKFDFTYCINETLDGYEIYLKCSGNEIEYEKKIEIFFDYQKFVFYHYIDNIPVFDNFNLYQNTKVTDLDKIDFFDLFEYNNSTNTLLIDRLKINTTYLMRFNFLKELKILSESLINWVKDDILEKIKDNDFYSKYHHQIYTFFTYQNRLYYSEKYHKKFLDRIGNFLCYDKKFDDFHYQNSFYVDIHLNRNIFTLKPIDLNYQIEWLRKRFLDFIKYNRGRCWKEITDSFFYSCLDMVQNYHGDNYKINFINQDLIDKIKNKKRDFCIDIGNHSFSFKDDYIIYLNKETDDNRKKNTSVFELRRSNYLDNDIYGLINSINEYMYDTHNKVLCKLLINLQNNVVLLKRAKKTFTYFKEWKHASNFYINLYNDVYNNNKSFKFLYQFI